jgi:hypothetical protein
MFVFETRMSCFDNTSFGDKEIGSVTINPFGILEDFGLSQEARKFAADRDLKKGERIIEATCAGEWDTEGEKLPQSITFCARISLSRSASAVCLTADADWRIASFDTARFGEARAIYSFKETISLSSFDNLA